MDIIHLEDGCEATSATLVLPEHSRLIKEDNYLAQTHSVKFKLQYTEIQDFWLLKQIFPCQLSPKELEKIGNSIPEPQSSSITKLQGQLKFINTKYPHSMPLYLKIVIACSSTAIIIIVIYVIYRYHKYGCTKGLLKPLCHKKHKQLMKTSNLGTTPAPSEFISDANMVAKAPPQIFSCHPRNGITTHVTPSTYSTWTPSDQSSRHERGISPKRCCESHSGQCGQGPRVCSQTEL